MEDIEPITVQYTIPVDKFQCNVCLDTISSDIFRCPKDFHFYCRPCAVKLKECGVCRYKKPPVHDVLLQKSIDHHRTKCENDGCNAKLFLWDKDHQENCIYKPITCKFCRRPISSQFTTMVKHYEQYCDKTFNILNINPKKYKFKITTDKSSVLIIVSNASYGVYCVSDLAKKCYYIGAISDIDKYIGQKLHIISKSPEGSFSFKKPITITDTKEPMLFKTISFEQGNELIFNLGSTNSETPGVNIHDDLNAQIEACRQM